MDTATLASFLSHTRLFSTLGEDERAEIAKLSRRFQASAGEAIAEAGRAAKIYLLTEGRAIVRSAPPEGAPESAETRALASECGPGDVIGELALNGPMERSAIITAVDPLSGFAIDVADFEELCLSRRPSARKTLHNLSRILADRLRALSRQIAGTESLPGSNEERPRLKLDATATPSKPSEEVRAFLRILPFFEHFDDDELRVVADRMRLWEVPRKTAIFEEGDESSSAFVVVRGAIDVSQRSTTRRVHISVAGPGTTVGVVPLVDRGPRRTTCLAREHAVLLELPSEAYEELTSTDGKQATKLIRAVNTSLIRSLVQTHAELVRRASHADFERAGTTGSALGLPALAIIDKPSDPERTEADARRARFHTDALIEKIRQSVIGDDSVISGPFGLRRIVYADYTASGRSLAFIEDFIRREVLPLYANTHTESSGTGLATSHLREDAREIIHESVGGGPSDVVIFCGSGATGAIDKLSRLLGIRLPRELDARYGLRERIPEEERPVVFIGPYEHHSNELVWRESIATVVTIQEDEDGRIDLQHLEEELVRYAKRPLKIGSFSAASNVTGIISEDVVIARLLHAHGALSFWDYAAAGPYLRIQMNPEGDPLAAKDAVFLSPHKFIGGPQTPGILIVKKNVCLSSIPTMPGGGTVQWVSPSDVRYLDDVIHREEAGTPAIIESIRAGLVFQLKEKVGPENIRALEEGFVARAIRSFKSNENLWILGNPDLERLSIISMMFRHGEKLLHWNYVVALLNDLFGIQARGGCSCAGPYGHRLLEISPEISCAISSIVDDGYIGIRPGWVRVNFNYFISETVFHYIVEAIHLVARDGYKLLPQYRFDPRSGMWSHAAGRPAAPLRLKDVSYLGGELDFRRFRGVEPESALPRYLEEAREILAAATSFDPQSYSALVDLDVPQPFESMRWFLTPAEAAREIATSR